VPRSRAAYVDLKPFPSLSRKAIDRCSTRSSHHYVFVAPPNLTGVERGNARALEDWLHSSPLPVKRKLLAELRNLQSWVAKLSARLPAEDDEFLSRRQPGDLATSMGSAASLKKFRWWQCYAGSSWILKAMLQDQYYLEATMRRCTRKKLDCPPPSSTQLLNPCTMVWFIAVSTSADD
jgi:hypothetical protein